MYNAVAVSSVIASIFLIYLLSPHANAAQASGAITIQGEQHVDLTVTGEAHIKNSNISGTLTVTGPLTIEDSHVGIGAVIGPLHASKLDAYSMHITGPVTLDSQTTVEDLSVIGPMSIKNSRVGILSLAGPMQSNNSTILSIEATSNDLHFWDTNLGDMSISYYGEDKKPIVLKLLGNSTVKTLSINSTTDPMVIIVLDSMTDGTLDKSKIRCTGRVEYQPYR
jgi:hypothetical protein